MLYRPIPLQTPPVAIPSDYYGPIGSENGELTASNTFASTSKQPLITHMSRNTSDMGTNGVPIPGTTLFSPPTPAPSPQPGSPSCDQLRLWNIAASPLSPTGLQFDTVDFGSQFIETMVENYPRLTLPERRKLFDSLLPYFKGEDLLHLSQLISPYLRRDFLAELPAEISLHILAFIEDPKDLVRASRVSRTWRSLVSDEQTWKVMLQRYRGRGWAAISTRPPIERIRQQHPEASFGPIASRLSTQNAQGSRNINPSYSSQNQASNSHSTQAASDLSRQSVQRISALSPTAQPFKSRKPSLSVQTVLFSAPGPSFAISGVNSNASDANVNRFLDENQTPLAERRRRTKGKSRASRADEEDASQNQPEASEIASPLKLKRPSLITDGQLAWQMHGLGFAARRQSYQAARSPNAPPRKSISAILPPPPPNDFLAQHPQELSNIAAPPEEQLPDDFISSPTARFATNSYSPAVVTNARPSYLDNSSPHPSNPPQNMIGSLMGQEYSSSGRSTHKIPSTALPLSPVASRNTTETISPKLRKYISRRSTNPFGRAVTTCMTPPRICEEPLPDPFSYRTQFKKAYLTESNWLKGPGRVLSTQISSDDGVVTSLGFDNEWIVVGMATNQVHVFDARTGEYARELSGHTAGVWCLVLVSKGGERLDEDGKKVKQRKPKWQQEGQCSEGKDEEGSGEDDGWTSNFSDILQRSRSASARPPDTERFFQNVSSGSSPFTLPTGSLSPERDFTTRLSTSIPTFPSAVRPGHTSLVSPDKLTSARAGSSGRINRHRRPSSFSGVPSHNDAYQRTASNSNAGFPFDDAGKASPQQASACGTALGWGQRGAIAVTAGCDRDLRVWDVEAGRCIFVLRGHLSTVRCLKVLDGRPIVISGSRDATLRVWDIENGVQLRVLAGHQHSVRCIEIVGNIVVSGSYDTTCRIWNVDTGECLHLLQGHQHQIYAVAFDGVRVASGSLDSTVRIWSAKTGECLALLQGHTSLVGQLQLTDSVLVTGGSDGRVIIFSLSTFECLHRLCAHDNSVTCLQFNDRFMVTGGNDGRVKLWDRPSGKLIRELAEPCEAVWRVTFREDKCVLLCKRNGRTVMDVRTFAPSEDEL